MCDCLSVVPNRHRQHGGERFLFQPNSSAPQMMCHALKRELRFSIATDSAGSAGTAVDATRLAHLEAPCLVGSNGGGWRGCSAGSAGVVVGVVIHAQEVDVHRRTLAVVLPQLDELHHLSSFANSKPRSSSIWAAQSLSLNSSRPAQRTCSHALR